MTVSGRIPGAYPPTLFPNETSFWETPLRIKEIAGDRRANGVSGPNPAADFVCGCALFFSAGAGQIAPGARFPRFCLGREAILGSLRCLLRRHVRGAPTAGVILAPRGDF